MKSFLTVAVMLIATSFAHADLIITEFLADALAVGDAEGEYFELFNSGATAIDVGSLTIGDDGSDSLNLTSFAGVFINPGAFVVFGNEPNPPATHVDVDYSTVGSFFLSNGADEIVVTDTATGTQLARVDYFDGDTFGDGIANVLNNTANAVGGVTQASDYIAEVAANNTLTNGDTGSPGIAGSTVIGIPEPSTGLVLGLVAGFGMIRRKR